MILIIFLLAAQFGAAQEAIVVYKGAETSHFVDQHTGSEYFWEVYESFNPDIEADPAEFYFTVPENTNAITVHWLRAGMYYLKVNETDPRGCSNIKALAISVLPNNRSIGFARLSSNKCYHPPDTAFQLSIAAVDDEGKPLESTYFPIDVSFMVDGVSYTQSLSHDNQEILIDNDMFVVTPESDKEVVVEITQAVDSQNGGIQPSNKRIHTRTIFGVPVIEFATSTNKIVQGRFSNHRIEMQVGDSSLAQYSWSLEPVDGTSSDLESINENSAEIVWDGSLGLYTIKASAIDGSGCESDTITQQIEIVAPDELIFSAGNDTTISSCSPYQLQASVSDPKGLSYLWEPGANLDDPTSLNPIFTSGNSTRFVLTVIISETVSLKDTIDLTVSDIYADAGDDLLMEEGATAILDGSASLGADINYLWTTSNGTIESGGSTARPIVSNSGTYYLDVIDLYGCSTSDSVVVNNFIYAPIANDDYDTTNFQTAVSIPILANDSDPGGNLDASSLSILQYPLNGSVYINYDDYSISYTPVDGFVGDDVFEYRICNLAALCNNANVYVFVVPVDFFIPEAFTPNGDNVNDYFEIEGIENYEGNSLTVLNRWGKKVYETQNYGIDTTPKFWDGKWSAGGGNEDLPTGTYFYVFDLGNGQKPIAGTVYIDR